MPHPDPKDRAANTVPKGRKPGATWKDPGSRAAPRGQQPGAGPGRRQSGAAADQLVGRRELRHAETRREILHAARELVVDVGAEHFNLRDLAQRARFGNPASLYRYFESRQEILVELAKEALVLLASHLRLVPEELPPDEQMVELGMIYLEFAREHPAELRLILATTPQLTESELDMLLPFEVFEIVQGVMQRGVDQGIFHARDEQDVFAMWHGGWALVQGLATVDEVHSPREQKMLRSRHRGIVQAFVNGLKTDWTAALGD